MKTYWQNDHFWHDRYCDYPDFYPDPYALTWVKNDQPASAAGCPQSMFPSGNHTFVTSVTAILKTLGQRDSIVAEMCMSCGALR